MHGDIEVISTLINDGVDVNAVVLKVCYIAMCLVISRVIIMNKCVW